MRNINFATLTRPSEVGQLQTYSVHYLRTFNFTYDVVDDIALNDPARRAMVCAIRRRRACFSPMRMKKWSDKTATSLPPRA
jgi:acetyl-CoA synthetase